MCYDKVKIAKQVTSFVVRRSVSFVAANAIANLVPTENKIQKIELIIGASVIGGVVADKGCDFANAKFDELVESMKSFMSKLKEEETVAE